MAEQTVTLQPSESKVVTFEATPHEAKTYQVSVNGLTGSFTVAPLPPFTFSNESVYRKTCPRATAWDVPVYDCRITNPSGKTVTHRIEIWSQSYSHSKKKWYDPRMITRRAPEPPWDITLGPGQSHDLHFDGWYYDAGDGEWRCDPCIAYHYTILYWLQDENGNRSEGVSVYRP